MVISRRHPPPPQQKPERDDMPLGDDVLHEILLRVPPLPTTLIRAAAVCRRWRHIVAEPGFLRRYRAHHGKPPLLGFFVNPSGREPLFRSVLDAPGRVPPERFSLHLEDHTELGGNWYYHGCRHGRLILVNWKTGLGCRQILIWDPITRDLRCLSPPPQLDALKGLFFQATVVCAAADMDEGHVHGDDCRSGPFKVVLVGTDRSLALAFVYSSETGEWGDAAEIPVDCISVGSRCVQVGNCLYWMIFGYDNNILEFNLGSQRLSVVEVPMDIQQEHDGLYPITLQEGTELGLIVMSGSCVQIWQWMIGYDGVPGWLPIEAIYLDQLLSLRPGECVNPIKVMAFAQDENVLFVASSSRIFMVYLDSLVFKQLCSVDEFAASPESCPIYAVYPFACFYDAASSLSSE
ncbi:hypothetical protein E2562_019880 [Oryza meyeriana var. granulata]|uniref:F-box domain-containing protein n=1 Tax=Oryza meyeriana var. granulata TaxID=110450 RepID=A0A6G1EXD4_9ORYZ|nr:hypothetical protein E2562_019880 [Oryza meyeriana var. granulata]